MKKLLVFSLLVAGLTLVHCGDEDDDSGGTDADSDGDSDGDSDSDSDGDAPDLDCGELITVAQLSEILEEEITYNEEDGAGCEFEQVDGMSLGTIAAYNGGEDDYDLMLQGAYDSLAEHGEITEPDDIGLRSFQFVGDPFGMQTVEIGFLDSTGSYAVLVTTVLDWANFYDARLVAMAIDGNIANL